MTTREMASKYRLAQWAEKLGEQKSSGLNIRQWCELRGVKQQQYFYWQRKLRQTVSEHLPCIPNEGAQAGLSKGFEFTQVSVVEAQESALGLKEALAAGQVRIEVSGVCLSADATYPPEQLARLVRELARLC